LLGREPPGRGTINAVGGVERSVKTLPAAVEGGDPGGEVKPPEEKGGDREEDCDHDLPAAVTHSVDPGDQDDGREHCQGDRGRVGPQPRRGI